MTTDVLSHKTISSNFFIIRPPPELLPVPVLGSLERRRDAYT